VNIFSLQRIYLSYQATGATLPKWGYGQEEVACDKNMFQDSAIWNVEEHIYHRNEKNKEGLPCSLKDFCMSANDTGKTRTVYLRADGQTWNHLGPILSFRPFSLHPQHNM
jgi:hypothetical protein